MDGITLAAVRWELEKEIGGAKLEKVQQPERDTLIFVFRGNRRLLLSINPSIQRVQLTKTSMENPMQPPMFCMLLRKVLQGGQLLGIDQPGFDRVLHMRFSAYDEMGEICGYRFVIEIMGKHSNLILLREDGQIVDSILRVTPSMSSVRTVLPGGSYVPPPPQDKLDPRESDRAEILRTLEGKSGEFSKLIGRNWSGISPGFAREIALLCGPEGVRWEEARTEDREELARKLAEVFRRFREGDFAPTLVKDDRGEYLAYYPFDPPGYDLRFKDSFDSMSQALDVYYQHKETSTRLHQTRHSLGRILQQHIDRLCKRQSIQTDILTETEAMERNRLFGELLTANAYRLEKGMTMGRLENYYADNAAVDIPLDPQLSPNENAQKYFKKYQKMKAAYDMAEAQLSGIRGELSYLEGQQDNLQKSTTAEELREIREELIAQGYARPQSQNGKKAQRKPQESRPFKYLSSSGREILVGKNNAQNDRLTMRTAKPNEMWLHTKNTPGSHVLILGEDEVDDQTLLEAAQLAAYYSKARQSGHVPVDYTLKRNIKKPAGSVPGYVIYSTNYTMYVTPEEEMVLAMKRMDD